MPNGLAKERKRGCVGHRYQSVPFVRNAPFVRSIEWGCRKAKGVTVSKSLSNDSSYKNIVGHDLGFLESRGGRQVSIVTPAPALSKSTGWQFNLPLTWKQKLHFSIEGLYWNATILLMSMGGWELPEWSPCTVKQYENFATLKLFKFMLMWFWKLQLNT